MSLINDALKKAQTERQVQPLSGMPAPVAGAPQPPRRNRSFLLGFLVALLVVSLITSITAAYFVRQILGPSGSGRESAPAPAAAVLSSLADLAALQADVDGRAADGAVAAPAAPAQAAAQPEAPPAGLQPATAVATPQPPPPPAAAAAEAAAHQRDPAVAARLLQLEIRGIMSASSRVLILDTESGRTKAYRVGETLEGSPELSVDQITDNSIRLKDYAGHLHTKSF